MTYPANTPDLTDLSNLPLGEIAALPPEELLRLQDEASAALDAARRLKERLEGAIAQRAAPPPTPRAARPARIPARCGSRTARSR